MCKLICKQRIGQMCKKKVTFSISSLINKHQGFLPKIGKYWQLTSYVCTRNTYVCGLKQHPFQFVASIRPFACVYRP